MRRRVSDQARFAGKERPHQVRNRADRWSSRRRRSHCRRAHCASATPCLVHCRRREKRLPIGRGDELGATLRIRIGIASAHRLVLAISPDPLPVHVALVARDVDDDAGLLQLPERLQQMNRAHDVGRIGFDRIVVAATNDRLRRHVDHDVRTECRRSSPSAGRSRECRPRIATDHACDLGLLEEVRLRRRIERVSGDSAPSASSHSESQLPLKPVWPVTKTLRPFQNVSIQHLHARYASSDRCSRRRAISLLGSGSHV